MFNAGHLWYLEHLLLFSVVYALWRRLRATRRRSDLTHGGPLPRLARVPGLRSWSWPSCSALVRIWSPIDRWFNLLGFFRVAFADVPRDLAFFIFGVMAFERGWFERFPPAAGLGLARGRAGRRGRLVRLRPGPGQHFPPATRPSASSTRSGRAAVPRHVHRAARGLPRGGQRPGGAGQMARGQPVLGLLLAPPPHRADADGCASAWPAAPLAKFALVTVVGVAVVFAWSALLRLLPPVRAVL